MTCIIGHIDGWMVADRRVTSNGWRGPYDIHKVTRFNGACGPMLVGVAGTMALLDKVRSIACGSCSSTNEVLDQLSGLLSAREDKHDTDALVVFPGGLIELDPAGGQYWVTSSLWAIGCGSYSALSYLRGWADGLGKRESELRPEDAVRAIEHVATVNTDVGDGCQVERIGEPNGSHG